MNIALIGYGKMGKMIEEVAISRNHAIVLKLTSKDKWDSGTLKNANADVAIEFTQPHAAVENIKKCFDANIPVVVGTTGWYEHLEEIKKLCLESNQALLYASNFSIGVNLFFKINQFVASLLKQYPEYDVSITEVHHTQKKDAPSGTAITLAEQILPHYPQKNNWNLQKDGNNLYIRANRAGDEKGFHQINYQSSIDEISISHHAFSRKGFALGAVLAAEFIKDKKGVFQMKDVLSL
ncbi:MAG: 4-hydroxy-tetrahydrodipicolinate reductase [Bacteroidia bacterium]|nr:MAG: 4-hydroxy-tetrahydrodipicolinate reductase [Bacteroidia bacterium]